MIKRRNKAEVFKSTLLPKKEKKVARPRRKYKTKLRAIAECAFAPVDNDRYFRETALHHACLRNSEDIIKDAELFYQFLKGGK